MSQNSLSLPTTGTVSGLQMTQNTNNALDTLNTLSSGASAPSSVTAGQLWHDTANNLLKMRDQANSNWIAMGYIDETSKVFTPSTLNQAGFVNRFRNGTFDVAQRGTSGTITAGNSGYTLDGWILAATGANIAWGQGYSGAAGGNILNLPCAAGITGAIVKQRIESIIALPLASKQVTVQFTVYNNSGAGFTPQLTVKHANAADNWTASTTDVNAVSLQTCANAAVTTVAYSFVVNSAANYGLELALDLGNALNQTAGSGIQVQMGKADIRITSNIATGLNNTPPLPELRPVQAEIAFCERYFEKTYQMMDAPATTIQNGSSEVLVSTAIGNGVNLANERFRMRKRTAPTIMLYNPNSGASGSIYDLNNATSYNATAAVISDAGFKVQNASGSTLIAGHNYTWHYTASAEL